MRSNLQEINGELDCVGVLLLLRHLGGSQVWNQPELHTKLPQAQGGAREMAEQANCLLWDLGWWPKFSPWNSQVHGRIELTSQSCPLIYTCHGVCTQKYHTRMHNKKLIRLIKWKASLPKSKGFWPLMEVPGFNPLHQAKPKQTTLHFSVVYMGNEVPKCFGSTVSL